MSSVERAQNPGSGLWQSGRQDDGLGPAAAGALCRLGWRNVTTVDDYQLNIEDALDIAAHDIVWFVDAAKTGFAPFSVQHVRPSATLEFTSHLLRPAALLAIAKGYCKRAPPAFLLGIRGYEFAFAETLTPGGRANLRAALAMLIARIARSHIPSRSSTAP